MIQSTGTNTEKKELLIVGLATILAIGLITAVAAYYLQENRGEEASYEMAYVSCEIQEDFNGQQKNSIIVKNTSNVPAYIRVRLISYWQTPSGKIAGRSSPELKVTAAEGWTSEGKDVWSYSEPVEPGTSTPNLLSTPLYLQTDGEGYIQVVKVLAEAIQTDGKTVWKNAE